MAGIQLTNTIKTLSEAGKRQHGIFQAAFKGGDQALKDYYVFIQRRLGAAYHRTLYVFG